MCCRTRLGSCAQPLQRPSSLSCGHRKAEIRRDRDEFFAVPLLDPGRDRIDRMSQRVGADRLEISHVAQAVRACAGSGKSAAPRRGGSRSSTSSRAEPGGARAFAFDDFRKPVAGRALRHEEQGIETPHRVEFRDPSRERRQRLGVDAAAPPRRAACANGLVRDQRSLKCERGLGEGTGASPTGIAVSSTVSRIAATAAASTPISSRELTIRRVDAAAGKDQRTRRERHSLRALDHQQLRALPPDTSRTTIKVAAGIGSSGIGSA